MPILVPGPVRLQPTRTTRAVRQTKPLMAWTPRPSLYGTPPKICLPGQAPAIWKKRPYLTGVAKHRESGLTVVDKTEAANCLRKAGQGSKKTGTTGTSHELAVGFRSPECKNLDWQALPGPPSSREFRHKRPQRRPRWGRFFA